jgi:hypothetical protein
MILPIKSSTPLGQLLWCYNKFSYYFGENHTMLPSRYNFEIWRGDTFTTEIDIIDQAGLPVNITDWSFKMEVKENYQATPIIVLSTDNGKIQIVDGPLGKISLNLTPTDTAVPAKRYIYDLQATTNTNDVITILFGSFFVYQDVTQ